MSYNITIGNYLLPDADIVEFPKSTELIEFNQRIIPDSYKIVIDNTDKATYDDRFSGSVFYAVDFYGDIFDVYSTEYGRNIFTGKIKNISVDDGSNRITIEATTYIDDLSKKTCVYSNASDKTAAECIYEILTAADAGNVDTSLIIDAGFSRAIAIQTANSVFVNVAYTADDKKTVMNVINELCRLSNCQLYCIDNLIHLYQWQQYDGTIGHSLERHGIIPGTYRHYFDENDIKNSYRVAYASGASIATDTGTNSSSITTYGERVFAVPDEDVDSTTASDYKILLRNTTGATYCGVQALLRFAYIKKYCEFESPIDMEYIKLGDVADLRDYPYYGEPIRIIKRVVNSDAGRISFKGEFLNKPHSFVTRDEEPPPSPELVAAIPLDGGVCLKWTRDYSTDHAGYKVYFTPSKGEWFSEMCHKGRSPIDNKSTSFSIDGYIYQYLYQLSAGTNYCFRVSAYDTSNNESDFSNVLEAAPLATSDNMESCKGNPATGITLDAFNSRGGTVPSDCSRYSDDNYYDSDYYTATAYYESGICRDIDGFYAMTWATNGDSWDIEFQYRTASTQAGIAAASWSTAIDATAYNSQLFNSTNPYMQYRFIFHSPNWSDTDTVYVKNIVGN